MPLMIGRRLRRECSEASASKQSLGQGQGATNALVMPPHRRQMQDEAFQRMYENDHSWEALQEDEQGLLRLVSGTFEASAMHVCCFLS